jgi:TRAP-type mannitol/chloroaromatic compound transport system permease small subunit
MSHQKTVEEGGAKSSQILSLLRVIDGMSEWMGKVFSFLIVVATFQVCYELIRRYFFNSPTTWGLEMTLYLCSTTYVMSGAYAERFDAHIKVDIFYNRWSKRTQGIFDLIVTDVLLFFFCGLLVWHSAAWFLEAAMQGLTSGTIWDPPIWPMRLVILVGALGLLIAAIGKFVRDCLKTVHNKNLVREL